MRNWKLKINSGRGFTIVELLVSVFIIVLMTVIAVVSWREGEVTLALDRAAHTLGQDIRKATELAQRAQFFQCETGSISGYGVYVAVAAPTSYILYAECNGDEDYDSAVNGDTVVQTITLENGIEITSAGPGGFFSVLFIPPVPTITIQPGNLTQATVTLSAAGDPSRFKVITVTTKGIIDID